VISDLDIRQAVATLRALNQNTVPWPFWIGEAPLAGTQVKFLGEPGQLALPPAMQLVRALNVTDLGKSPDRGIVVLQRDALLEGIAALVDFNIWYPPQTAALTSYFTPIKPTSQGRVPACLAVKMRREVNFVSPDIPTPNVDITQSARGMGHDGHNTVHRVYMMLAFALLSARGKPAEKADQNIAALLVAPHGKILGWAVNQKSKHPMLHAETTLVLDYIAATGAAPPQGSRVYTTLQSCKMCAATLTACAPGVFVYYGQQDGGDHAQGTVLANAARESALPKDVMAWAKGNAGQGSRELGSRLASGWEHKKANATNSFQKTAWAFLRSDARGEFDRADTQLRAKFQQYFGQAQKAHRNPNVEKVVEHVITYGVALGLSQGACVPHPWVRGLRDLAS
jgi:tRNA(Arg) A34 adenosine deaminase TadA